MIEKVSENEIIECFNCNDIFAIRIKSLIKSYGTSYDFARFFVQKDDSGCITSIMSALDLDYTLCVTEKSDFDELRQYFAISGFTTLLSDKRFSIDCREYSSGNIMRSDKTYESTLQYAFIDEYPRLMDLFNFIDYEKQDFESWYVDLNHRIRHKTAKAYALKVNDQIISSAILTSIWNDYSIISSVRTENAFRKMGYGKALVDYIVSDFGKTVFLMREKGKNKDFYNKCGFIECGKWRIYK